MNKEIKNYHFKAGLPVEFEILDLEDLIKHNAENLGSPHRVNFYNIIWIEEGNPTFEVDFSPIQLASNTLLMIPPDAVKIFDTITSYKGKAIIFTNDFFNKRDHDLKFLQCQSIFNEVFEMIPIQIPNEPNHLSDCLNIMLRETQNLKDIAHYDILKNTLHSFLLEAERNGRMNGVKTKQQNTDLDHTLLFKREIESHFKTERQVAKYAEMLGISEKRLYNATTTTVGKSPKQVIDERILLEAKRLLTYSIRSVKEISFELGYDEPTNFIKYFKKHIHATPNEFRALYQS